MYQMATSFVYVRDSMMSQFSSVLPQDDMLRQPLPPTQQQVSNQLPVVQVNPMLSGQLGSITEVSESDSSDSSLNGKDDLQEIPIGALILNDDDDTETTASLSEDSASVSPPSCTRSLTRHASECQLDHQLSKCFVQLMLFQFRTEGRIRNGFSYCWSSPSSLLKSIVKRKRKNSSMAVEDDEEMAMMNNNVPEIHRSPSDGSGDREATGAAGDESFSLFMNSTREDRLDRRRSNLVAADPVILDL